MAGSADDELLEGEIVPAKGGEMVPVAGIEVERSQCPRCLVSVRESPAEVVRITHIARNDQGWIAEGRYAPTTSCPSCGAVFDTVAQRVDVECAQYSCGHCGPDEVLRTEVLQLTADGDGYVFTVALTCPKCSRRGRIRRAVGGPLRRVKRLRIGVDGVEVETRD